MRHDTIKPEAVDTAGLPPYADRRTLARIISERLFPISYRTLEAWPLPVRHVNGRAVMETKAVLAFAASKLAEAPIIMGGRGKKAA
jgi:hypothetical protein